MQAPGQNQRHGVRLDLVWAQGWLTAQFIEDEVELERKLLNVNNLTRKDVGPAKVFWTNAMNFVDKFALGS